LNQLLDPRLSGRSIVGQIINLNLTNLSLTDKKHGRSQAQGDPPHKNISTAILSIECLIRHHFLGPSAQVHS